MLLKITPREIQKNLDKRSAAVQKTTTKKMQNKITRMMDPTGFDYKKLYTILFYQKSTTRFLFTKNVKINANEEHHKK